MKLLCLALRSIERIRLFFHFWGEWYFSGMYLHMSLCCVQMGGIFTFFGAFGLSYIYMLLILTLPLPLKP